jgi:hypothetical protein
MPNLKRLRAEIGKDARDLDNNLTSFQASDMTGQLIAKGRGNPVRINGPCLGIAMKESFRLWTALGKNIWSEKREAFIRKTVDTYNLFAEIAERVEQNTAAQKR